MIYDFLEELKDITTELIKRLYKKLKYVFLIFAFIILIFSICIFNVSKENNDVRIFNICLEDWANWMTTITLPITAIWAMHQYYKNNLLRQQEKAAEIARLFSEELLDKCSLIAEVIKYGELGNLYKLKETDMNKLQRFDREEIIELYENDENFFNKYKKIFLGEDLQLTYFHFLEKRISNKSWLEIIKKDDLQINKEIEMIMKEKYSKDEIKKLKNRNLLIEEFEKYYLTNHSEENMLKIYRREYTNEESRNLFILDNQNLPFKFTSLVSDVLNELEYICMYISSQSAGANFVYQSLHQIFLRTVKVLAVTISYNNKNYADKYYTNIIHVYKEWSKKMESDKRREKKNKRKAYKYLEPKIKTV